MDVSSGNLYDRNAEPDEQGFELTPWSSKLRRLFQIWQASGKTKQSPQEAHVLLRHMHEMFSIMDKRENDGVCIGQQLEELEGRKAEEDAVQEWNEAVKRERSLRNKLQAVEATLTKYIHSWKLTSDKHAAIAVQHAADSEEVLRESFAYLKSVKAATAKLPAGEAKSILQQISDEHESRVVQWYELGIPLAGVTSTMAPSVATVSDNLAGMTLSKSEVAKPHGQKSATSDALPGAGGQVDFNNDKENETKNVIQQRSAAKNLQNEVATFTQVKVALNDNGATSPADAKLEEASGSKTDKLPPNTPFTFAASDGRNDGKVQKSRKNKGKRTNNCAD